MGSSPTNASGRRSLRRVRLPDGSSELRFQAPIAEPSITTALANETLKLTGANVDAKAWKFFPELSPTHRRDFVVWIHMAKWPDTRKKRIRESLALLAAGKRLGLK